ncbi:hypothetical protein Tco_0068666, partial [Tanacetum coccineum]
MLSDSLLYLEILKLDHRYLLPISLPELFVTSHGGTMTMSLMHQWHDTICGGGTYGCILDSRDPFRSFSYLIIVVVIISVHSATFSFPAA